MSGSTLIVSTITTPVIATATSTMTIGQNTFYPNRSIEIGTDAANSVYLDFHSSDSALPDYSTRIQSLSGATTGQGHMMIQGSTINILGTSGVGIGTSNPGNAFHVYGASAPAIGMGNSTAANFFQIGAASFAGSYSASAVAGDAVIRTTSGNLMLQTGTGAAAVYVNTSNNIIMNYNASSPSTYKLCVEQGLSNNNGILISNSNYGSAQQFQLSMVNAGSGNFYSYAMVQTSTSGVAASVPLCLQPNSASVGIGTTAPTGKCHVYGGGQSTALSDVYSFNVSSADSFNGDGGRTVYSESINMKAGDLTWANYGVRVYGARIYIGGGYSINAAQNQGYISMFTGNTERVRVSDAGFMGVGTASPITKFNVVGGESVFNGNVYLNSSSNTIAAGTGPWVVGVKIAGEDNGSTGSDLNVYVSWQNSAWYKGFNFTNYGNAYNLRNTWGGISDATMKENIIDARNYLDDIRALRVVKYSLKVDQLTEPNQLGLIAQEVEAIFPKLVSEDKDGLKYLKSSVIGMMQLKSIQELADKNDALEAKNAELQAIIDTQSAQIATILARLNAAGIA